jgi:hypothetical protein
MAKAAKAAKKRNPADLTGRNEAAVEKRLQRQIDNIKRYNRITRQIIAKLKKSVKR